MPDRTCSIEGCAKTVVARGWCDMHYRRWKHHGDLGGAASLFQPGRRCVIGGCENPVRARGWCNMHYLRWKAHGDPSVTSHAHRPSWADPSQHPRWKGDDIGYGTAHRRVEKRRGSAAHHPCEHCGSPASEWAYDHADPAERESRHIAGRIVMYSLDPSHYMALCVTCHRNFDSPKARRVATDSIVS